MKWNIEGIEFLKNNYGILNIKELMDNLNRSENSIRMKAYRLNLTENHFWIEEEIEFLKNNYGKLNIKDLENILNRNENSIRMEAHRLNLRRERLSINEDFFKQWTPEMAYIFGLWIADGYMFEKNNLFSLSSKDYNLLEIVKSNLESGHKICENHESFQLQICNKTIYNDLIKVGGHPAKSLTIQFPEVPDEYLSHFIRGYFDGDGCNYIYKNKYLETSFIGNVDFLTVLKDKIKERINIKTGKLYPCNKKCNPRIKRLQYNGKKAIELCDYIYQDSENQRLERKFDVYDQMKKEHIKKIGNEKIKKGG